MCYNKMDNKCDEIAKKIAKLYKNNSTKQIIEQLKVNKKIIEVCSKKTCPKGYYNVFGKCLGV